MANKKISELDSRATLGLSDLMVVGDPSTGYAYKTTLNDVKSLVGSGVNSFNGRIGAVVPAEGDYTVDLLGDVSIATATSGQLFRYNGTNWANWTPDYLTAETDTLDTVTGRGNSTANGITVGSLSAAGLSNLLGHIRTFATTGNVYIGANPGSATDSTFKLDVNGTVRLNGATTVTGVLTGSDTIRSTNGTVTVSLSYGSTAGIIGSTSNHALEIRTNNVYRIGVNTSGVVNIANLSGTGSRMVVADAAGNLSTQSFTSGTVTSVGLTSATSGITITGSPVTASGNLNFEIATASGSQNGLLSSADWTTFNNKQNALTNPVTGTGAAGQVSYWSGASAQAGSNNLFWDATNNRLGIGLSTPATKLELLFTGNDGLRIRNSGNTGSDFAVLDFVQALVQKAVFYTNNDNFTFNVPSGQFVGQTGGSQRFRITNGGNFIINNASTDNGLRLQVTGDGYFSGSVGIGTTSLTGISLRVAKTMTGAVNAVGIYNDGQVQSDVTTAVRMYRSQLNIVNATFTIPEVYHYLAEQGTIGASSTVTNQYGFITGDLTKGTNNYAFYGSVSSGTGRWNLYINGSASNFLSGQTAIGDTAVPVTTTWTRALTIGNSGTSKVLIGYLASTVNGAIIGANNSALSGWTDFNIGGSNIIFRSNGENDRGRIHSSGNWLIGTSTDSGYRLDVVGTFRTTTTTYLCTNTGNTLIGTTTDAGFKLDVNGTMRVSGASTFGANVSFGTLAVGTGLRWNNTNNRLGIGTDNPFTELHVRNLFGTKITVQSTNTGTIAAPVEAGILFLGYGNSGGGEIVIQDKSSNVAGGFLVFRTRDVSNVLQDRLSIDNTGASVFSSSLTVSGNLTVDTNTLFVDATNNRVGIGTISPTYTLSTVVPSSANADIFLAGMTEVSNGFTVQRISSSFVYTFLDGSALMGSGTNTGERLQVNGDSRMNGELLLSSAVTSIPNGDYSSNFSKSYTPSSLTSNVNSYGIVSNLSYVLSSASYTGSETYNASASLAQVSIAGNATTKATQPFRVYQANLLGRAGSPAMNIADFRFFDVKTPDADSVAGHVIDNIYGLKIAQMKGASNYTITNGWGIYQEGANDNNYFNGSVGIGTNTISAKLHVNGDIRTAAPSGGTAVNWKFGNSIVTTGATLLTTRYLEVEVDGVVRKLALIN